MMKNDENHYKNIENRNITRDDFDGGPVSLDEIEPGLWLGNVTAATDVNTLKSRKINHILTVDICPLPTHITQIQTLSTKFIQISDVPKEDFLGHFLECIEFIETTLTGGNSILVHCYFGVSRSATIVIAYIMRKYKIGYDQAFQRVKSKRRFVGPNAGFITQLKIFYKMGYKIDPSNDRYKQYRLRLAADSIKKAKILPQIYMDLLKPDPSLIQINPEPIVYRCKKCRRVVATKNNLVLHKRKDLATPIPPDDVPTATSVDELAEKFNANSLTSDKSAGEIESGVCHQMYFIEPIAWMKEIQHNTQGRLHCPKCKSKLGNFSWVMGCQCPCGQQVSPAFYLVPSRVEYSTVVQNVQVTV